MFTLHPKCMQIDFSPQVYGGKSTEVKKIEHSGKPLLAESQAWSHAFREAETNSHLRDTLQE